MKTASGIHHITAIASDPKQNYDFYTQVLGLRFIKKTVNYDDPGTYHFYYGDKTGSPGTILTFFPHPGLPKGRAGTGQAVEIGYTIPKSAFPFWIERFHKLGLAYQGPEKHFDDTVIRVQDPDGLMIELVGVENTDDANLWTTDEIGPDAAIRGFHSITMWVNNQAKTAKILTEQLGFKFIGQDGSRYRYAADGDGHGKIVDLRELPGMWKGAPGAGTIHHVAWRVGGDEAEEKVRTALKEAGQRVTEIIDRNYFHSVYFRESNGILFELATDHPGFAIDEPVDTLGEKLMLPPIYEAHRDAITAALPPL